MTDPNIAKVADSDSGDVTLSSLNTEVQVMKNDIGWIKQSLTDMKSTIQWAIGIGIALAGVIVTLHFVDPSQHWWIFAYP